MEANLSSIDIYRELPQVANVKRHQAKSSSTNPEPFTPALVESLLTQSSNPSDLYANRIQKRQVALENPAKQSRTKQLAEQRKARQAKDAARRKLHALSRKDASIRGIWELRKEETKYKLFLPLHHLWKSYIGELMGLNTRPEGVLDSPSLRMPNPQGIQAKLVKADFHGSILTVSKSKNPSLVGCRGIVILETENTFKVITEDNHLKVLPKKNSIFVLNIPLFASSTDVVESTTSEPMIEFELYGDQFTFRASERATRKFKHKLV